MPQIAAASLMTLEAYARGRNEFRAKVLAHKKSRTIHLGDHVTLLFEDELTIRYQIQEMLRIERIFEQEGIRSELDAYNPLIPDGENWKATMLIEYPDAEERHAMLSRLKGIERRVWVRVGVAGRIHGVADEDMERENTEKTSAVHFLRFQLPPSMIEELDRGAQVVFDIDHPDYVASVEASAATRSALVRDLR